MPGLQRIGVARCTARGVQALAALALAVAFGSEARAQIHGVQIGKSCQSPQCVFDITNCLIQVGHGDGFGDTIEVQGAFDVIEPSTINERVPAVGNLPIVTIQGNAFCTDSGGACQPDGTNCALPCRVGPASSTLSGLPGDPQPGLILFRSNEYVIQPGDPMPLRDQANVTVQDLCDSPTTMGCSDIASTVQFTASTTWCDANDGNDCTVDSCEAGVCSNASICTVDPDFCDDSNVCTMDTCDGLEPDCCSYSTIPCEPRDCFENTGCDPDLGCLYVSICTIDPDFCDDGDLCTTDECDDQADGCCAYTPVVCDERACFNEVCEPAVGCVYTSICDDDPDFCDDDNVCTSDVCSTTAPECCTNTTIPCDPRACFNNTGCDPVNGCQYQSVCEADPDFCDDGDACTMDTCNVEADGCCEYTNICVCGDGNIDPGEFCDGTSEAPGVDCTDACDAACTCCGDDMRQGDEDCDGMQFESGAPSSHGECRSDCTYCGNGTVDGSEQCDDGNNIDTDACRNDCTTPDDFAGCTPGFWKQPHHLQYWPAAYEPTDRVDDVFGVDSTSNPTLLQALSTGGGGEIAFLRHAVSALLNSAHGDVDYLYSTAQVIAMVQAAYASGDFATPHGLFAEQNELGCTVVKNNNGRPDERKARLPKRP